MDDFIIRAGIAGIGVALVAGPLGAFIVWRRMAFFGETLAHSALLGIALGLVLSADLNLAVIAVCVVFAVLMVLLQQQTYLAGDTVLSILAHASLSLGLVTVALVGTLRIDLMALLFGDVLAVTTTDVNWIWGGGAVAMIILVAIWRPLLALTVDEDLARVEGVPVTAVRLAFMLMIALVIAVALKVVGVLLITSLLIIPAAAARRIASTPEGMAILASLIGVLAVIGGIWGSWTWDTPTGPSIVLAAMALFLAGLVLPRRGV